MPIRVRRKGEKWRRANDIEFADEAELQKMLYEGPELVSPHDQHPAVFVKEAGLPALAIPICSLGTPKFAGKS